MTTRLQRILLTATGGLVVVTFLAQFLAPDIDVAFTEAEVAAVIDKHIPFESEAWPAKATVQSVAVDFQGNRGIAIDTQVDVTGLGLAATGTAATVTQVRYEDGAFYLSDLRLDDLTLQPDPGTRGKLAVLKEAANSFLDRTQAQLESEADRRAFQELRTTLGPKLRDALDQHLGQIPVYRLQGGLAQWAAVLALKDVSFSHTEVIATLSPAQALLKLSIGILGVFVAFLVAFHLLNPRNES